MDIKELENKPIAKIKENRKQTVLEFDIQKQKYEQLKKYVKGFQNKFRNEKQQLGILEKQLKNVEAEIKNHKNLQKTFNNDIISKYGKCPTCDQEVTTNLISTKKIVIPQLTLEENINFLKSQKKLIISSIDSLHKVLKEKETPQRVLGSLSARTPIITTLIQSTAWHRCGETRHLQWSHVSQTTLLHG